MSLLVDCSPHRTRTQGGPAGLPPTGPTAEIKGQLTAIRKCIAPMALAKLGRPAGLQPIKQIQKKARVQGREVPSAKTITKARRLTAVANAKAKSGHGSPSVLRGSKAARRAARKLKRDLA